MQSWEREPLSPTLFPYNNGGSILVGDTGSMLLRIFVSTLASLTVIRIHTEASPFFSCLVF